MQVLLITGNSMDLILTYITYIQILTYIYACIYMQVLLIMVNSTMVNSKDLILTYITHIHTYTQCVHIYAGVAYHGEFEGLNFNGKGLFFQENGDRYVCMCIYMYVYTYIYIYIYISEF